MKARFLHPIKYLKDTIALYDDMIYTNYVKDETRYSLKFKSESDKLAIDESGVYKNNSCTFFFLVEDFPNYVHIDFCTNLRQECLGDTRISVLTKLVPHKIAWNSAEMKSKLRILGRSADEIAETNVNAFNMHSTLASVRRNEWIQESLTYLSEADVDRGRSLFKTSILLIITGTRGEDLDMSLKNIQAQAEQYGIILQRVLFNIPAVLAYFSPWSQAIKEGGTSDYPSFVLTDELVSRINTYSQGTLGSGGVIFGTDIYSHYLVLKYVKQRITDAENWLITAETGGGKSYYIKALILQLLAQGYNGTIMDIEGFEYLPLVGEIKNSCSVQVINMAEGQGGYFDPVEIPVYNDLDEETATQMRTNSSDFTLGIFQVLLGKAYNENNYLSVVINDAVANAYAKRGVTSERRTWVNSRGMTLKTIYTELKELINFRPDNEDYVLAVREAIALTSKYFEPGGTRAELFNKRVNVNAIINSDLIICSFGMAGKSETSVDAVQMALMQLSAAQISHQRSVFSKMHGKYNFKLWEEFQRWGKFPGSEKTLGVALTGGRKLGDVNIIVTNEVAKLLDDDKFNIFSNITSFLCGAIGDSKVRSDFCNRLSIPNMLPALDLIAKNRRDPNDDTKDSDTNAKSSKYQYAFLCGLDRTKFSVVSMNLPTHLANSPLFKTGVQADLDKYTSKED